MKSKDIKKALRQLDDSVVVLRSYKELYFINREQLPVWLKAQIEPPYRQFGERLYTLISRVADNKDHVILINEQIDPVNNDLGTIYASMVSKADLAKALKIGVDTVVHYRLLNLAKHGELPIHLSYHIYGGCDDKQRSVNNE